MQISDHLNFIYVNIYITFNCTYNKGFLYLDRYMLISILKPSITFLSLLNIKNNNNR